MMSPSPSLFWEEGLKGLGRFGGDPGILVSPRKAWWQRDSVVVPEMFVEDTLRADGPAKGAHSVPTAIHWELARRGTSGNLSMKAYS